MENLTRLKQLHKEMGEILTNLDVAPTVQPKAASRPGLVYAAPRNSFWYMDVSKLPVHPNGKQYGLNIGNTGFHADFGGEWEGKPVGIPLTLVNNSTAKYSFKFLYADESDNEPYPVGTIEPWSDRHSICIHTEENRLYEIFNTDSSNLTGDSGAIFDLSSNRMRRYGDTSADAAGLQIALGLVRYDEVEAGEINHCIRFTAPQTHGSIRPASHKTSGKDGEMVSYQPPLGAIFRLRADFDLSVLKGEARIIGEAMQKHGVVLADNGAAWFISGCPDPRWNVDNLQTLIRIRRDDMEMVDTTNVWVEEGSYAVKPEYVGA